MAKRKYKLPHYDRASPICRLAVRRAHIGNAPECLKSTLRCEKDYRAQHELYKTYVSSTAQAIDVDPTSVSPKNVGIFAMADQFLVSGAEDYDNYMVQEKAAMHNYAHYGEQVFSLSPLIAEMFVNTDLGKTKLDDLKLPYGCFYISLEESEWLDGFYVNHLKAPDSDSALANPDALVFVGVKFRQGHDKWDLKDWNKEFGPVGAEVSPWIQRQLEYDKYYFQIEINAENRGRSLAEIIKGVHADQSPTRGRNSLKIVGGNFGWTKVPRMRKKMMSLRGTWTGESYTPPEGSEYSLEGVEGIEEWWENIPGIREIKRKGELTGPDRSHALSAAMVRVALSLILYMNTEEPSVETEDFKDEIKKAKHTVRGRSRKARKRAERREARALLKKESGATFHRVGEREEREITSTPGFSFDQPRHWRKGHMAMRWIGPVKENGERIPYVEWKDKRGQITRWILPTLIHPEKEYVPGTNLTVVKTPEEDDSWVDEAVKRAEGDRKEVTESKIERNPKNRRACIEAHGPHCYICGEDGSHLSESDRVHQEGSSKGLPKGWLHCHHIEELAKTGPTVTDPEKDMVPLCAGCHAMIHLGKPAYTLEEGFAIFRKWEEAREARRAKRKGLKFWK